jgi:hypothetical protein
MPGNWPVQIAVGDQLLHPLNPTGTGESSLNAGTGASRRGPARLVLRALLAAEKRFEGVEIGALHTGTN